MGVGTAAVRPVAPPGGFLRALGDERLVARVRGGDDRAFEAIYDRHHRGLLSFCRHMLGSREEAEDALQHSFASAYRSLLASDRPIQLKAWLYAIARNQCLSILRTRREQVPLEEIAPVTEGLAAEVERRGELRELLGDLQRLPADQRAALVLAELGAHSHNEIAVILGVRRDKVKALVFQAREALATSRQARDSSCREIQEQLSVLRGGALRRGPIRGHLQGCLVCQAFRAEVARQRAAMAVVLPVAPSLALKGAVLGPLLGGAAGTAAAGAGAGAIGGLTGSAASAGGGLSLAGKGIAAKALIATALAGGVGGGTAVVEELHHQHRPGSTHPAHRGARAAPAAPAGGGAQGVPPGAPALSATPARAPAAHPRAAQRRRGANRHRTAPGSRAPAAIGALVPGAATPVAPPAASAPAALPGPIAPLPANPAPGVREPKHPFGVPDRSEGAGQGEQGREAEEQARKAEDARKENGRKAEQGRKAEEQARKQQVRQAEEARTEQQGRKAEQARKEQEKARKEQEKARKEQARTGGKASGDGRGPAAAWAQSGNGAGGTSFDDQREGMGSSWRANDGKRNRDRDE